jgi:hypothetical protein
MLSLANTWQGEIQRAASIKNNSHILLCVSTYHNEARHTHAYVVEAHHTQTLAQAYDV